MLDLWSCFRTCQSLMLQFKKQIVFAIIPLLPSLTYFQFHNVPHIFWETDLEIREARLAPTLFDYAALLL